MSSFNLFHYFLLIVIGQGFFLSLTLFTLKKGDHIANKLLATVVLLMTHFTLVFFVNDSGLREKLGKLFLTGYSIVPLIPVFIYFYLNRLSKHPVGRQLYLHFIPFTIQFLYWLPNNTNGFLKMIDIELIGSYYTYTVVRIGSAVHILIFIWYAYLCYHKIDFKNSDVEKRSWMKTIQKLYLTMSVIFIIGTLSLWFTDSQIARYVFFSFLAIFIYLIGYYGYAQSDILFEISRRITKPKYLSSSLSSSESVAIFRRLQKLMDEDKLFLNPHIKIKEIADRLGVAPHHLSRSINENFHGSYPDFINKYRVEFAKQILLSNVNPPKMFAVAIDSGFGNRVSFYKNFKKFTGSLPSKYIRPYQSDIKS